MMTVTAFEAKTRFGKLLERVARGEEVVITRHEKPVARIVPERAGESGVRAGGGGRIAQTSKANRRAGKRHAKNDLPGV